MQYRTCGRTADIVWDPELDMWLVRVEGVEGISHCGHWPAIEAHIQTLIEAEEDER